MRYVYNQPIVLQNHAPPESLNQMMDSIQYLYGVIEDAFGKVSAQIAEDRTKLTALQNRIAAAQEKVTRISKYKARSTTVYSLAKYPAKNETVEFQTLKSSENTGTLQRERYNLTLRQRNQIPKGVKTTDLFQELTGAGVAAKYDAEFGKEGLGRLPDYLKSVSSCLLFNTNENPYKKYSWLDNLEGIDVTEREKVVEELASAPQTIQDATALPEFLSHDMVFKPELRDVPVFEFGTNLTFLGSGTYATDVKFSANIPNQTMAPSAGGSGMRPNTLEFSLPENPTQMPPTNAPPPPAPVNAPPPPPTNVPPPVVNTPAPGPPPAAPKPVPAVQDSKAAQRNALLDAIRNPNKAKKKKVVTHKAKKPKKPPQMDVMSALKDKLKRRANMQAGVQPRNLTPPPREAEEEEDGFGITKLRAFRLAQNLSGDEDEKSSDEAEWDN